MTESKKQRIENFASKLIEKTIPHRIGDVNLIKSQIEACEKWEAAFFDAAEKLLNEKD
jgi:hypothetical protein